ncbi:hypothetical protein [Streptomyces sp. NPDC059850]|uniref:hypothetical protein n=1 Tax=Streptomyces sp. NPDC059850 TaxID=3346970 RepID=UPI00365DAC47
MTSSVPPVQIHVLNPGEDDDVQLTNVGVVNINGERHLFLSPQSFDSAVRQVSSAMQDLPLEQVERLVRECGQFKDFDELLGPFEPAPLVETPPPSVKERERVRPRGRLKKWAIAAALLPALAGSWALGHFTSSGTASAAASAPDPGPSSTGTQTAGQPFDDPKFMDFSHAGQIDCRQIDNLEAECTDADGMVMSTKAATGPDSTIFTFSYGSERVGLRIFHDTAYAETWARQEGTRELYPHLRVFDRYILWGTDPKRIGEYRNLLEEADRHKGSQTAMGEATPLPPRLAALALGTLGLDGQDVHQLMASPAVAMADAPTLLAARLVMGLGNAAPAGVGSGGDDIVALAVGIEPSPSPFDSGNGTGSVPATESSTGTTTEEGSGLETSPSTPTTTPATDTKPPTTPTTPSTPTAPQPSTPPSDPVGPVPSAPETPSPPAAGTPATEEEPAPAEEAPAPAETSAKRVPIEGQTPPTESANRTDEDLLILDSTWPVAAT